MAKKTRFDGIVVKTIVSEEGYVHSYDKNDRLCWGSSEPERVLLVNDLRKYAPGLHIGQLGWTIPNTSDGYKWIDVCFDNGPTLSVLTFGLERVLPEKAELLSQSTIQQNRGTRFDADPNAADQANANWLRESYSRYIATGDLELCGEGDEEVYGFTFPSLQTIAAANNETTYPIKIGFTRERDGGALARIRGMMFEPAAFPERPNLLFICRTWNGRSLELAIHSHLRKQDRKIKTAPGAEWYKSNKAELVALCDELRETIPAPPKKPVFGASPTLAEVAGDADVEICHDPNSAGIRISITPKQRDAKPPAESSE